MQDDEDDDYENITLWYCIKQSLAICLFLCCKTVNDPGVRLVK